ncbi:MAG: hypothetical protein QM764_05595 [Chitinophagaceae bacterium]
MKKNLIIVLVISVTLACNNAEQQGAHGPDTANVPKTHEDSLLKEVMDGHNITMAKTSKINAARQKIQLSMDSINKLSAKSQDATKIYRAQLEMLTGKLNYADSSMNKWMEEFNYDSATNGSNRATYLETEKKKIDAVEAAMLLALHQADSLFKK